MVNMKFVTYYMKISRWKKSSSDRKQMTKANKTEKSTVVPLFLAFNFFLFYQNFILGK